MAALVEAGATVSFRSMEADALDHVVMGDPEGNEFCVVASVDTTRTARNPLAPGPRRVSDVFAKFRRGSAWAQRLPRRSCSRSIASSSASKLPLPKPSEPCR